MRKSRFTDEQIISILKQSDAGASTKELCRNRPATEFPSKRFPFPHVERASSMSGIAAVNLDAKPLDLLLDLSAYHLAVDFMVCSDVLFLMAGDV